MQDINLLPEDLRSQEEKRLAKGPGEKEPVAGFHIPARQNSNNLEKKVSQDINNLEKKVSQDMKNLGGQVRQIPIRQETQKIPIPAKEKPASRVQTELGQQFKAKKDQLATKGRTGFLKRLFGKKPKGRIIQNIQEEKYKTPQLPEGVDVNLVPEGAYLLPNKKIYFYLALSALLALLLIGLGILGAVIYQSRIIKQEQSLSSQLSDSEARYNQLKVREDALSKETSRLILIKRLFNEHIYWTKFFTELENLTMPEVYYTDIDASLDGSVALSAMADSYLSVARQYLAYLEAPKIIKGVNISELGRASAGEQVSFSIELIFSPEIYYLDEDR